MLYFPGKARCIFSAATVFLTSFAFADTTPPSEQSSAFLAMLETQEIHRQLSIPAAGLYTLRAPANTNLEILVDGTVVVDATGSRLSDVGEMITAFLTLQAGDHVVTINGLKPDSAYLGQITINAAGQEPQLLTEMSSEINADAASQLVASRAISAPAALQSTSVAQPFGSADRASFSIGGGSSRFVRQPQASETGAGGSARMGVGSITSTLGGGRNPSGDVTSPGEPGMNKPTITPVRGVAATIGSIGSGGSGDGGSGSGGGVGGGGNGGGSGGGGGGGTPPNPPDGTISGVSPLTPPTDIEPTMAIQLLSAGNQQGVVPVTGATLFGAAMDSAMFDTVQVTVAPTNRTTIVDVGSQTGQFAVRLFPEDFANGPNVTVTLTGLLSTNPEVQSAPVSYDLQGRPVADGVSQALSRVTYGATPELYARVRGMGFEAYVRQQLNPSSINDRAFERTNPQNLLNVESEQERDIFRSLIAYKIARAAYSEKQLQEIMGHFWANHFHAVTKGTNMYVQNVTDRLFYRDNAFGNFEDLLLYSARSPLMSQYLDNDQNRRGRPNQNYGREILELSTVGVDAGYDETDIDAIAEILTGWGYRRVGDANPQIYEFEFYPDRHEPGDKFIPFLNLTIAGREGEAGVEEGEELISILAQLPETRQFVCGKIVQLLVADQPPANLVQACAASWEATNGEIQPMLEAILLDPSFITEVEYQRTKVKTPFEYAVSTMRAFGAEPTAEREGENFYGRFRALFEDAGYDLLRFPTPTGLAEVGSAWTSSATLIGMYDDMGDLIRANEATYGITLEQDIEEAGLETAEEVAAYLLTIATADRFTSVEFDSVVSALKGEDGIFDPLAQGSNETAALRRAMGVIIATPSFLLQ